MRRIQFLLILSAGILGIASCSNEPNRRISDSGVSDVARVGRDGRVAPRNPAENQKKVEYYNSIQHR